MGFEQVLKKVLWRLVTEGRRRGLPGGVGGHCGRHPTCGISSPAGHFG